MYVVTVFLNKQGTTDAAALGAPALAGFWTVIAGGWAYSILTADLFVIAAL